MRNVWLEKVRHIICRQFSHTTLLFHYLVVGHAFVCATGRERLIRTRLIRSST